MKCNDDGDDDDDGVDDYGDDDDDDDGDGDGDDDEGDGDHDVVLSPEQVLNFYNHSAKSSTSADSSSCFSSISQTFQRSNNTVLEMH